LREIRRQQRLPDAANRPGSQHALNSFNDDGQFHARLSRNFPERIALKALQPIFGNGENVRVDRIGG
jgi:hypothetical protein